MALIIVQNMDFDGSYVGINGEVYPVSLGVPFEASAALMEVLTNAGVPFLQEPFDLGTAGQIKIDRKYRGPRFVIVNGTRESFPVGEWFTPSAAALPIIMASTAGQAIEAAPLPAGYIFVTTLDSGGNHIRVTTLNQFGARIPVIARVEA